ncbi:DegQ family serine endoprotease [Neisseria sp. Ec49-e6-T10]
MLVSSLILGGCGDSEKDSGFVKEVTPAKTDGQVAMLLPDFTQLVEKEGTAVVNIQASRIINTRQTQAPSESPFPEDDPFFDFFRKLLPDNQGSLGVPETEEVPLSYGSGFIISPDGFILTNAHVVNSSTQIKVTLNDKRELPAKLIGSDTQSDIAVLKVDAKDLPIVKIGSPRDLKVGEWVAAIGAPFGFDNTVTAGIVSAKGRSLPNDNYTPFIQTDVAINPGNSGGPLFNLKGQVVGINSRIYSGSGGFMGISFAIPIDIAMNVAEQLRATGKVNRGQLGVLIQEVNYDLAQSFGLEKPIGALIAKIIPNGPAAGAKLEVGDIILSVDGKAVESSKDLPMMIGAIAPGQTIKLGVWRGGKEIKAEVKLGAAPSETTKAPDISQSGTENTEGFSIGELGLNLGSLTEDIKKDTQLDHGLLVLQVTGKAASAGLRRGDIILAVGQRAVSSEADFKEAISNATSVALLVRRADDTLFLPLKIK